MNNKFKKGNISFIGRSNVGKSTLLNTILNKKISIISNKPQTTRNKITGIYNSNDMQINIIDTPGIYKYNNQLGKIMNRNTNYAIKESNIICLLISCKEYFNNIDKYIIKILSTKKEKNILLLLTKIDLVNKIKIINIINKWKNLLPFKEIIPISSFKKININILLNKLYKYLPNDKKNFFIKKNDNNLNNIFIKEIIREKIFNLTKEEIPYNTEVLIENIDYNKNNNIIKINIIIIVEKKSQQKIIIGKKGNMIKKIGIKSRLELENIFNSKIILKTFVKTIPNWRNNLKILKELGYN